MWAATPVHFDPPQIDSKWRDVVPVNPGDPVFQVEVNFGQGAGQPAAPGTVVTLLHGDDVIGRGIVGGDGHVTIVPEVKTDTNNLTVKLQQDGALPASDDVERGTAAEPTSLTLQGASQITFNKPATFAGGLSPDLPGAPVKVVYTRDSNGETIEHTVTTDAGSDYTDTVTIARQKAGSWHAQASYAGDGTHGASSSAVLSFTVGP
jgi:hypothetical protein